MPSRSWPARARARASGRAWAPSRSGRTSQAWTRRWTSSRASSRRASVPRYDLLVRGGLLVDDRAARPGDIAVADGRIAAVAAPGELVTGDADELIEASGALVLPGGIDAHVHFDFALPPLLSQP